jgi:hypothetical protein
MQIQLVPDSILLFAALQDKQLEDPEPLHVKQRELQIEQLTTPLSKYPKKFDLNDNFKY